MKALAYIGAMLSIGFISGAVMMNTYSIGELRKRLEKLGA